MPREVFEILYKTKGADKTVRDTDKVDKKLGGIAETAKRLAGPAALGAVAVGLFKVAQSAVRTAAEFETLKTRLIAIRGSVKEGTALFKELNKIAATTPFALQGVVEAGATLEAFGADASTTTKSIADLAAFMGIGIVEASAAFGRAFAAGAGAADVLRERGVLTLIQMKTGIDDLTKLSLPEFRKAMIESIEDPAGRIAGSTDLLAETFQGKLSNMEDSVAMLSNALGSRLLPMIKDVVESVGGWADILTEFVEIGDVEKMQDEQRELNILFDVLTDVNTSQLGRNEAIKDLQDKYPDYIGNIDLEKASIDELLTAQKESNVEFERRIRLIAAQEMLADQQKELVSAERELIDAERTLADLRKPDPLRDLALAMGGNIDLTKANNDVIELAEQRVQSLNDKIAGLREEYALLTSTQEENGIQFTETGEAFDETGRNAEGNAVIFGEMIPLQLRKVADAFEVVKVKQTEAAEIGLTFGESIRFAGIVSEQALSDLGQTFMQVAQIGGKQTRSLFNIGKAAAVASSLINSYEAYTKALTTLPYPFNLVAAGITLTSGLAKAALISSQRMPGKQFGGVVEGNMLGDTQPTMLEPGEFVLNRHAVSSIGVETARRINETGQITPQGAQTVNNNFLVSFDEFFDRMENHRTRKSRFEEA